MLAETIPYPHCRQWGSFTAGSDGTACAGGFKKEITLPLTFSSSDTWRKKAFANYGVNGSVINANALPSGNSKLIVNYGSNGSFVINWLILSY